MTTVVGLTASRMQEIEAASVVDGDVVAGNLILSKHDGSQINAGPVIGPPGPVGPAGTGIPGEIKLWPGAALPVQVDYGLWTWANGDIFDIATYPIAAGNISNNWKTAMGLPNPGVGKFRVPDLRGLTVAGLDAMPVGSARANRLTRAAAIVLATKTGEEVHMIALGEMPNHLHDISHSHQLQMAAAPAANTQYPVGGAGSVFDTGYTSPIKTNSGGSSGYTGGSTPHETMQPTIFVPYIVKLDD